MLGVEWQCVANQRKLYVRTDTCLCDPRRVVAHTKHLATKPRVSHGRDERGAPSGESRGAFKQPIGDHERLAVIGHQPLQSTTTSSPTAETAERPLRPYDRQTPSSKQM